MLKTSDKIFAVLSIVLLCAAFLSGYYRAGNQVTRQLQQIGTNIGSLERVTDNLYLGHPEEEGASAVIYAIEDYPSYGGPLRVAVAVKDGIVETTALLHSNDTSTYLQEVVGKGVLKAYVGEGLDSRLEVDTITGASMSSRAMISGVKNGMSAIGAAYFDRPMPEKEKHFPVGIKDVLIILFFAAALFLSVKKGQKFNRLRWSMMILSIVLTGFLYASQFTLATEVTFLSGVWLEGVASYTSLICLVLAIGIFLVTRKNLFCTYICPFGAAQECLSVITRCQTPDRRNPFVKWMPRIFFLLAMMGALYFRNSSAFSYEPFGVFFNVIGSRVIFVLVVTINITSLIFKRPWCHLFCPVTGMFSFLGFLRNWIKPAVKGNV